MSRPQISLLLPVHNAMPFLPEAVDSILGQDFGEFELLALDDASTDGGAAYLDTLDDPRVRVFHLPKRGLTRNLNLGLREARGVYVARMDADDVSMPSRLRRQLEFLERNPEVVVVGCQALNLDRDGRLVDERNYPVSSLEAKLALIQGYISFVHPGTMFRREDVLAVGGYDEDYGTTQDRDLWWRLSTRGKFANLPEVLLHYRVHAGAVTAVRAEEQRRNRDRITLQYCSEMGLDQADLDLFRWVDYDARVWGQGPVRLEEVAPYVSVLERILSHARDRWGEDPAEVERARRERWTFLVGRLWRRRLPTRDWVRIMPSLHRLAPGQVRPDRLAGTIARRLLRRRRTATMG
ncbi:glycosyltransferase family 2 protein [Tautonia plasticadhaerens]|uniref:Chondroitin synthase n=1 Tax=Tautonia plasticadhaerens TaxID=2527974 RepID=A0A518H6Z2_9BACT|nr:glycosyltransferase [Tautonia plasticadhaerens]QDV36640.1 Chondroitin synthase [Tautonia plasticadhaerens]